MRHLVEGATWLVYYDQIRDWFKETGIDDGKLHDDQEVWEKYIALLTREMRNLLEHGRTQPLKTGTQYTGTIVKLERMNSSVNGNPRFRVFFQDDNDNFHSFRTQTDSAFGYSIQNHVGKRGWLIVSDRGIITDWSRNFE